jgi:hypothetical protein
MGSELGRKRKRKVKYLAHLRTFFHSQAGAHAADIDRPYHLVPFLAVLAESGHAARYIDAKPAAPAPVHTFITARQIAVHSALIHGLCVLNRWSRGTSIRRLSVSRAGFLIGFRLYSFRTKRQLRRLPACPAAKPVVVVRPLADAVQNGECLARPSQRCFDLRELIWRHQSGHVIRCAAQHRYSFSIRCCDLVSIGCAFDPKDLVVSRSSLDLIQDASDFKQCFAYSPVSISIGSGVGRFVVQCVIHNRRSQLFIRNSGY